MNMDSIPALVLGLLLGLAIGVSVGEMDRDINLVPLPDQPDIDDTFYPYPPLRNPLPDGYPHPW